MNKLLTIAIVLLVFSCKTPEARRPISVTSGSFIDASVERNKKLNAKEKASIEKLMSLEQKDYIASESGFWYYYNNKVEVDSLKTPGFGDVINYNYNIKALNGSVIYSTDELKTQTYAMDKEELFTGLREGLKLMKSGETVTFLFPSQKAYGYYGDENKIGRNTPLICEVTVNSITLNQSH
ncbi:gliding motility-associated peptidyl-prolyl isomerase GldI [Algibacter amylolyticus]|uniref:Peptidyl-prolyl cis-trans isomerase n=1 Tax=Algibacter amylolyticus TaxID=1608400 RepID=A0A5M7B8R0_9FLAO|nr:gliding motility-associated peptidyl-prolyl isomerase GldI [Algibacter amylolyticus]KAA5825090.1 gliding motility-associated peptidyl-prolyl isomerase GldI [Algibacter amylolyticus]MBB5268803.1 gliding motility-associated peptidyl-prolyl isomerase [Algibacter amylolyticus]TSJ77584.1 gliding motility-associated peptidyl-prolyl isomerase GldI [Algibacter amylolyticus]